MSTETKEHELKINALYWIPATTTNTGNTVQAIKTKGDNLIPQPYLTGISLGPHLTKIPCNCIGEHGDNDYTRYRKRYQKRSRNRRYKSRSRSRSRRSSRSRSRSRNRSRSISRSRSRSRNRIRKKLEEKIMKKVLQKIKTEKEKPILTCVCESKLNRNIKQEQETPIESQPLLTHTQLQPQQQWTKYLPFQLNSQAQLRQPQVPQPQQWINYPLDPIHQQIQQVPQQQHWINYPHYQLQQQQQQVQQPQQTWVNYPPSHLQPDQPQQWIPHSQQTQQSHIQNQKIHYCPKLLCHFSHVDENTILAHIADNHVETRFLRVGNNAMIMAQTYDACIQQNDNFTNYMLVTYIMSKLNTNWPLPELIPPSLQRLNVVEDQNRNLILRLS